MNENKMNENKIKEIKINAIIERNNIKKDMLINNNNIAYHKAQIDYNKEVVKQLTERIEWLNKEIINK